MQQAVKPRDYNQRLHVHHWKTNLNMERQTMITTYVFVATKIDEVETIFVHADAHLML
jgi:hypothetical protein